MGLFGDYTSTDDDYSSDFNENYNEDLSRNLPNQASNDAVVNNHTVSNDPKEVEDLSKGCRIVKLFKSEDEYKSKSYFTSAIYFEAEGRLIVSCTNGYIKIYNYETMECTNVIREHTEGVYSLIKWNDKSFLSCALDGKIMSFSSKKRLVFWDQMKGIRNMLKLDDELFICYIEKPKFELLVVKNSEYDINQIERSITCHQPDINYSRTQLLLSKKYRESSFWISLYSGIYLIDYKEDNIRSKIESMTWGKVFSREVNSIENYIDPYSGDEIVIVNEEKSLCLINTENKDLLYKRKLKEEICAFHLFDDTVNKFLVTEDCQNDVCIYDLTDNRIRKVFEKRIAESVSRGYHKCKIKITGISYSNSIIHLMVLRTTEITILEVSNLNLVNVLLLGNRINEQKKDLSERIEFFLSDYTSSGNNNFIEIRSIDRRLDICIPKYLLQ